MNCLENFLGSSLLLPPGEWDQELIKPGIQAAISARRKTMGKDGEMLKCFNVLL